MHETKKDRKEKQARVNKLKVKRSSKVSAFIHEKKLSIAGLLFWALIGSGVIMGIIDDVKNDNRKPNVLECVPPGLCQ